MPRRPDHLLSILPEDIAGQILAHGRAVALATGEMLFVAGDPGDGCYRVDEGLLKVSVVSPAGAERILAILGAGALVGEMAVLDGGPRSANVAAIRHARMTFIPRAAFLAVAEANPQVYRHAIGLLAARLRDANMAIAATSFLPLKGRVARALVALGEAFGQEVPAGRLLIRQKITQGDLAAMTGIARENVSRILNDWMRAKTVTRISGYYCIENPSAFGREAEM